MTVQHQPGGPGDIQSPANADQHPNSNAGLPDESPENAVAKLKREEVVCVLQEASGGYLIYSLPEESTSDGGKPLSLEVIQCQQQPLPDGLAELLVDHASLPPPHLKSPRKVHVLVSTHSGLRKAQGFYEGVLRPLLGAIGLEPSGSGNEGGYQVTVTRNANTVRDFARELGRDKAAGETTIILLSGDGGVVDILNGLDHTSSPPSDTPPPSSPTIALLPLGTGNALFHSLHKPHYSAAAAAASPLVLALRTLLKGAPQPLPTFRASFSPGARLVSAPVDSPEEHTDTSKDHETETPIARGYLLGAVIASYGFHASLVWESDTPAYRAHGAKRFGMAAAELLKVSHVYDATVEVRRRGSDNFTRVNPPGGATPSDGGNDGVERDGNNKKQGFNYLLTTLVSNLERTFTISPASQPLDGRLRVVYFGDVGGDRTMEIMMAAYRDGEHVAMAEVGYEEVEEVRVTVAEEDARWRKVCVDGSIVELERGGWVRVGREVAGRVGVLV